MLVLGCKKLACLCWSWKSQGCESGGKLQPGSKKWISLFIFMLSISTLFFLFPEEMSFPYSCLAPLCTVRHWFLEYLFKSKSGFNFFFHLFIFGKHDVLRNGKLQQHIKMPRPAPLLLYPRVTNDREITILGGVREWKTPSGSPQATVSPACYRQHPIRTGFLRQAFEAILNLDGKGRRALSSLVNQWAPL